MTIAPISDLRNYGKVLKQVSTGSSVYLTRNGRGACNICDISDENKLQEAEAMIQLLCELNQGLRSAEKQGWIFEDDFSTYFRNRGGGIDDTKTEF